MWGNDSWSGWGFLVERWFSDTLLNMSCLGLTMSSEPFVAALHWPELAGCYTLCQKQRVGETPFAKPEMIKTSGWDHSCKQRFAKSTVPASGVFWKAQSGRVSLTPLAVGSPHRLVSQTGSEPLLWQGTRAARLGKVSGSPAQWPSLTRVRGGPCRPPSSSARLRCGADPSAAVSAPGSAPIGFSAIPGWKQNGRHQGLAGNGDHDRYSPSGAAQAC